MTISRKQTIPSVRSLLILSAAAGMLLLGCQPPQVRPRVLCPGKENIQQAAAALERQKRSVQPFMASAECVMQLIDDKGKPKKEPVNGKIAFVPPGKLYFRGNKFGEVRFGTNESEFWLRVKPEFDSYWWGSKILADRCDQTLPVNPANVADALGSVRVTDDWQLSQQDGFDVLTLIVNGIVKKRVYVNTCDYRPERIEYFDDFGIKKISIEQTVYWTGDDGLSVPSQIHICYFNSLGREESSVRIELKHIRPLPPEKRSGALFERPGRDGYENVFRLNENCEFERLQE